MPVLTTDTLWTGTLPEGSYDIQKREYGSLYISRGTVAPDSTINALLIETNAPLRLTVKTGDTAYFYGDSVEIYYYSVE